MSSNPIGRVRLTGERTLEEPLMRSSPPPAAAHRWLLLAALCTVAACSEPTLPGGTGIPVVPGGPGGGQPVPALPGMILSGPIAASVGSGNTSAGRIYTSLTPGSIPLGVSAEIRNRRTRSLVTTAIIDGGFDPVAISAIAGDTLDIRYQVENSSAVREAMTVVPASQPPIIVRTEPVPGKRDVPLNLRMVVVFSEPLGANTLNQTSIQLFSGGVAVAGTVQFDDADRLRASFVPTAPLVPSTEYQLVISGALADVDGQTLGGSTALDFASAPPPAIVGAYERQGPTEYPEFGVRLVLYGDRTFDLQYEATGQQPHFGSRQAPFGYKGVYQFLGNDIYLSFNDSNLAGSWYANGTRTDNMIDLVFPFLMQIVGFENGKFVKL